MGSPEINAYLTHLAVDQHVSASTQNQALHALLFLYSQVLGREVGARTGARHKPRRLPVVLTRDEVRRLLAGLTAPRLMATLLYGSGLRLMECLRLRVCDLEWRAASSSSAPAKATATATPCCRARCSPPRGPTRAGARLHESDLAAAGVASSFPTPWSASTRTPP